MINLPLLFHNTRGLSPSSFIKNPGYAEEAKKLKRIAKILQEVQSGNDPIIEPEIIRMNPKRLSGFHALTNARWYQRLIGTEQTTGEAGGHDSA